MVILLTILQIVFSILVVSFSTYGIITGDYRLKFLMILFLGVLLLILGLKEFQKERKINGWLYIGVFLFLVFVSITSIF
ncbi:DUF3953 domain-containing protein [Lysinibacillus sp. FSL M8-0216]|uniref:DUF3953 domain-containing protein n=1 Tax=Lysinibacillus TaxID=400634 RepID=UPI000B7E2C8A|nr:MULTISPECIES: DUF3953 domain-containing protein [Lysinibacillus]MCG7436062.1 DUF3953 domain-containing protein [Lysinibacillus fusiformis]MED4669697.1 DUF3953 domain-containing protein [Lysinibacillus fusiformis]PCD84656.1 DUF3953 domain-containing protein [Lysinibacillus fusiformis]QAS55800.1 DUF3953 domain-containing protein [Lysinibacillus sphaericus]RDV27852.1 DUF3953 domain-containing protein [Lysinibacillus fusiformis]